MERLCLSYLNSRQTDISNNSNENSEGCADKPLSKFPAETKPISSDLSCILLGRMVFLYSITHIIAMDILFRVTLPGGPEMAAYHVHYECAEKCIQITQRVQMLSADRDGD